MLLQTIAISDFRHWNLLIPLLFVGQIPWAIYFQDQASIVWLQCRPSACRWTVVSRKLGQGRYKCPSAENPEKMWPSSPSFSKTQAREASWIRFSLHWSRAVGKQALSILQFLWRWNHHNIAKRSKNLNILPIKNTVPYFWLSLSHLNIWPLNLPIPLLCQSNKT